MNPHNTKQTQQKQQVYLLFDEKMTLHRYLPPNSSDGASSGNEAVDEDTFKPFENSTRIISLYQKMQDLEHRLLESETKEMPPAHTLQWHNSLTPDPRFIPLHPHPCHRDTIELAHSRALYNSILQTCSLSNEKLRAITVEDDLYFCRDTFLAASLACGGVVQCIDAVTRNARQGHGPTRALALVRPPGHHATRDKAMGFCYFNNIAVAAKHAIHTRAASRVLVVDWDIHHGNGIQDITYDDPNIFYLSIHRATFGKSRRSQQNYFYPGTGRPEEVGKGRAAGTNLNIVWKEGGMGNTEYAAAFAEVVLPVVSSFRPDLIIIACGFDAAQGDLLGDCKLTPDMYYIMTQSLLETAGVKTPFVVALEGGYDLYTIGTCLEASALALLDEPFVDPSLGGQKDNRPYNLARYWRHSDLLDPRKHSKTTKKALAAIKKSARALAKANINRTIGRMYMLPLPAHNHKRKEIVPLCNRPVQQQFDSAFEAMDCTTDAIDTSQTDILRVPSPVHRPHRDEQYPFKKRHFSEEADGVSVLI